MVNTVTEVWIKRVDGKMIKDTPLFISAPDLQSARNLIQIYAESRFFYMFQHIFVTREI